MRLYRTNGALRLDLQGEAIRLRQGDCGLALRVKLDAAEEGTSWRARISNGHCVNDTVELTPKDDGVTMLIPMAEQYLYEAGTLYVSVAAVKNEVEQWSNRVGITVTGKTNCCAGRRPVTPPELLRGTLTFTGAVSAEYDGSKDVVVNIPSGGSGDTAGAERTVWNATCDTDGLTQRKTVRTDKDFTLKSGRVVLVTFKYVNGNNNATLNVNNTGAKPIRRLDGTTDAARLWSQGQAVPFVYDGECWIVIGGGKASTDLYGITRLSSATDSASEELAATPKAVSAALTAAKEYADKASSDAKPLLVTVINGQADYGVSDIKTTYDAGGNVQLFDTEGTYYAYLNHVDSKKAVFVEVDTQAVRVYTVDSDGAVSVASKELASGSGGSDVSLTVEGSKYTLTIGEEKTSWTIPTALKNPNALTFTGAVTGTYDGSKAATIKIPEAETVAGAGVTVVNTDGSITAEEIYNLSDGTYWFAQKFEQSLWSGTGTNLNVSLNTLLVGLVVKVGAVCYCQTTGYAVEIDPGQKKQPGQVSGVEIAAHPNSGVRVTGWPTIKELPTVTTSDAGKILMVNDSGEWAATAITNAEEVAY